MRGFLVGLVLIPVLVAGLLSIRPGGLRRQLRHAARRLRIALVLGGIYILGSALLRLFFRGPVGDYGPAGLAVLLALVFVVLAQDPDLPAQA